MKNYLTFWSQFQNIHLVETLPKDNKFQYVFLAIFPQSKSATVVESFLLTMANYPKAMDQLKNRFRREDLLVQIYVKELLCRGL